MLNEQLYITDSEFLVHQRTAVRDEYKEHATLRRAVDTLHTLHGHTGCSLPKSTSRPTSLQYMLVAVTNRHSGQVNRLYQPGNMLTFLETAASVHA